jgi:hypothetical protein
LINKEFPILKKKLKMKKLFYLFLLILTPILNANASHLASAEIRYEKLGNQPKTYIFYLTILKGCEPGSADLNLSEPLQFVDANSNCGFFTQYLPTISTDTITYYCPGIQSSCYNVSSSYPSFVRKVYSDTVTFPSCDNYLIHWTSNGWRNSGITNLLSASNYAIYVEARLNSFLVSLPTQTQINNSSWLPNPSPFVIAQGVPTNVPLNVIDADYDSLDLQWYAPRYNTINFMSCTYTPGFSLAQPFGAGGQATINTNNTITLLSPVSGKFNLGLVITEYRNGEIVGYTMRDFLVLALPTAAFTPPQPSPGTNFQYNTCPGAQNNIVLNFTDPDPTDSVFLQVNTPAIPGFTFNTTTTSSQGAGTATINWVTPSNLNPAILNQFHFDIIAKDNDCPANGFAYYGVNVTTSQCQPDSVWPGDANGDYTVNFYDPLAVAVAYNKTGILRAGATINWQAEFCPPWADTFINGVNIKHADCNGDAIVDTLDLYPITSNYGNVHVKGLNTKAKVTGLPDLYFDLTGINFYPGATVSIPIKLGSSLNSLNNIYGFAGKLTIGNINLSAPPTITYPSSWLGSNSNTLNFTKTVNNNILGWAYSRIDHQNVSGYGTIANINFTIPLSATPGNTISFSFDGTAKIVDNQLNDITGFNEMDTTALISPSAITDTYLNRIDATLIPNPAGDFTEINLTNNKACNIDIMVNDISGRLISSLSKEIKKGKSVIVLPTNQLQSGMYIITIKEKNTLLASLKLLKKN